MLAIHARADIACIRTLTRFSVHFRIAMKWPGARVNLFRSPKRTVDVFIPTLFQHAIRPFC